MRRLFLPLVVFAVTVAAIVLTIQANDDANPGDPDDVEVSAPAATPVLSVRRAPEWLRRPKADGLLEAASQDVLRGSDVPEASCLRVDRDDEPIAENGKGVALVPGRVQRLVSLAALDLLVPETGFTTRVVRAAATPTTDGVLEGDLWLVGGGDPTLSTADFAGVFAPGEVHTSFEELAADVGEALRADGITRVQGRVVGDESRYPVERDYERDGTWGPADNANNAVGPLSALLVNNGFVAPFPDPFDPAALQRAADPAASAARSLQALLTVGGIEFGLPAAAGTAPTTAEQTLVAEVVTDDLRAIASRALVDATTAEMLFKAIGQRVGGIPTRAEAAIAAAVTLAGAELTVNTDTAPKDGSGLSGANLSTCDLLVEVLKLDDATPIVGEIVPPVADGSLAACAPETTADLRVYSSAAGAVTAVAGRSTASNGDVVTFAMIANQPFGTTAAPYEPCNAIQHELLDAIAGHPYGPALDDIGPLPVEAAAGPDDG